jgi:hypothetical protein
MSNSARFALYSGLAVIVILSSIYMCALAFTKYRGAPSWIRTNLIGMGPAGLMWGAMALAQQIIWEPEAKWWNEVSRYEGMVAGFYLGLMYALFVNRAFFQKNQKNKSTDISK